MNSLSGDERGFLGVTPESSVKEEGLARRRMGSEYSREREQFEQRKRHRTVQCVPEIKKLGTAGGFRGKNGVRDVGR